MMRKILFLDIDGVLNTGRQHLHCLVNNIAEVDIFGYAYDPEAIQNLSKIVSATGADIVISSSWKFYGLAALQEMWRKRGMPGTIIDITPNNDSDEIVLNADFDGMLTGKGYEIKEWLSHNGADVSHYVIIDDNDVILPEHKRCFVQTNPHIGITKENAEEVIEIMNKSYKRGIHDETLKEDLSEGGVLHSLVELVKSDKNLVMQIRDNYFNIYYQGGNVAKVNSKKSVEVDKNYFRKEQDKDKENWDDIKQKHSGTIQLFKCGNFTKYIEEVTKAMLNYWKNVLDGKGVEEKHAQHEICIQNNNLTDYTVIDLEYEVSKESVFRYRGKRRTKMGALPSPRFDIIAVRNKDHRLCVIELKKGTKALKDPSGVQEHAEAFTNTIAVSSETQKAFLEEMNEVLLFKQAIGLMGKGVFINMELEPEFLFAYQYDPNDKTYNSFEKQKQTFRHYQHKNIENNDAKDKMVIWLDDGDYLLKD